MPLAVPCLLSHSLEQSRPYFIQRAPGPRPIVTLCYLLTILHFTFFSALESPSVTFPPFPSPSLKTLIPTSAGISPHAPPNFSKNRLVPLSSSSSPSSSTETALLKGIRVTSTTKLLFVLWSQQIHPPPTSLYSSFPGLHDSLLAGLSSQPVCVCHSFTATKVHYIARFFWGCFLSGGSRTSLTTLLRHPSSWATCLK